MMLNNPKSHSVGGILLGALALASSVTSSALPTDVYNHPRDTSCETIYGKLKVVYPGAYYVNYGDQYGQFGVGESLESGLFSYQNCGDGVPVDLFCENFIGPNKTSVNFGLSTHWSPLWWAAVGVPHIAGPGPSDEVIPTFAGSPDEGSYWSESALWVLDQATQVIYPIWTGANGNSARAQAKWQPGSLLSFTVGSTPYTVDLNFVRES